MKEVNELIRGEMSAVQSFDSVLEKLKNPQDRETLKLIRQDHVEAVEKLKKCIGDDYRAGEDNINSSGPWGSVVTAFTGGASFFGDKVAIKALKFGEEHGINEYKELLKNEEISSDLRHCVENELLPQQERHLSTINKYLQ